MDVAVPDCDSAPTPAPVSSARHGEQPPPDTETPHRCIPSTPKLPTVRFEPASGTPYPSQRRRCVRCFGDDGCDTGCPRGAPPCSLNACLPIGCAGSAHSSCGSNPTGGGTPTVMVDELIKTIRLARDLFTIGEVSTETNPNHLIDAVLAPLQGEVQRLSVGVQSLDDNLLRQMKRFDKYGSADAILRGLERAQGKLPTFNIDMIFNLPSLTDAILTRDLERLRALGADQVTYYPLMVSPSVAKPLEQALGRVDYRREARQYRLISRTLAPTYQPTSAWAFSRSDTHLIDEYIVDHPEYVGVGSGSFSYLAGEIYANTFSLKNYQAAINAGHPSVDARMRLSRRDQLRYRLMMDLFGLRLDKRAFAAFNGTSVARGLPLEYAFLKLAGAFERDDALALTLSETGRYLLVVMMREFFIGVNGIRDLARATLPEAERALFEDEPECASRPMRMPPAMVAAD